jgi:hypothetical protein
MPEESPNETNPSLLEGLGSHFHAAVAQHVKKHEENSVIAERKKRLADLAQRFQSITDSERYKQEVETKPVHVETLDSGTKVDAYLKARTYLVPTIGILTNEYEDRGGKRYLKEGAMSSASTLKLTKLNSSPLLRSELNEGLNVRISLETPYHFGDAKTADSVLVGVIVDPESIIVPELPEGSDRSPDSELYSVIGPDDSRFAAIMAIVDHIANSASETAAEGNGTAQIQNNQVP